MCRASKSSLSFGGTKLLPQAHACQGDGFIPATPTLKPPASNAGPLTHMTLKESECIMHELSTKRRVLRRSQPPQPLSISLKPPGLCPTSSWRSPSVRRKSPKTHSWAARQPVWTSAVLLGAKELGTLNPGSSLKGF